MKVAAYEWKDGARLQPGADVDPNAVGGHIELLRQQNKGELTPKDVLDDARNPNSPLHTFFEWDDNAAAEQYRLHQARGLIKAVVAVYVSEERPAQRIAAFVHIPEAGAPHYRATGEAMSSKKTRELVLRRAWQEFQQWKTRYQHLSEFSQLFEIADQLELKIGRK